MNKIGLVVEGGGMKCAYSAGILDAFLDYKITFDYCIGVSAGAANLVSYLAGQRGRNLRFYTEHLKDPGYFGVKSFFKTGNLFGLDYIYRTLSNSAGKDPLDFPAFKNNPVPFYAVATNAVTGTPEYFSKDLMKQDDYSHIIASCSLPGACRPMKINGVPYYDGGISDAIPIERAFLEGCDKIVVILCKPKNFIKPPEKFRFLYSRMCRNYPNTVQALNQRHIMYRKTRETALKLEQEQKAFLFAPSTDLKTNLITMDAKREQQLYDLGIKDFHTLKEQLEKFLNPASQPENPAKKSFKDYISA